MEMIPVMSSAIEKVGYAKGDLFIKFVSGKWYKYLNVPETVFEQLPKASSKGTFVNRQIKPFYQCRPLTSQELEMVRQTVLQR